MDKIQHGDTIDRMQTEDSISVSRKRIKISNVACCETVTLEQWHDGSAVNRLPLVDLRTEEEYSRKPLKCPLNENAPIVNLPFDQLISGDRSCELPPRNVNFAILIPANVNAEDIERFFFATESSSTLQSRKPWLVRQMIFESRVMWQHAKEIGINPKSDEDIEHSFPLPRLWKPDEMVENILSPMLIEKFDRGQGSFVVWDLGSGAGRDVSFLAEQLKAIKLKNNSPRSIQVVGFDCHKGSARRSLPLWKNRMVDDVTQSRLVNLKKLEVLEKDVYSGNGLICLYAVRLLNRTLLDWIAKKAQLMTGCIFAMSHFCKENGQEWTWDHPKENNVLSREELNSIFCSDYGWKITHDDICLDGDHGRPMVHFCAEKTGFNKK